MAHFSCLARGRGCRKGQEGAWVPPNMKKTQCVACFLCHGGDGGAGEGREAGKVP